MKQKNSNTTLVTRFCVVVAVWLAYQGITLASLQAEEKVTVHLALLEERLNEQGTAPYNKFINAALKDNTGQFVYSKAPVARSDRNFLRDQRACLFPTGGAAWVKGGEDRKDVKLEVSLPVDVVWVRVFYRDDRPKITDFVELKGKTLGYMHGTLAIHLMDVEGVKLFQSKDEDQLLHMLSAGRLYATLGHDPDVSMAMERLGITGITHNPDLFLFKTNIHMVCKDFEGVDAFLKTVNQNIRTLNESGELQKLLGRHATPSILTE